jgi:hypothetical protein
MTPNRVRELCALLCPPKATRFDDGAGIASSVLFDLASFHAQTAKFHVPLFAYSMSDLERECEIDDLHRS